MILHLGPTQQSSRLIQNARIGKATKAFWWNSWMTLYNRRRHKLLTIRQNRVLRTLGPGSSFSACVLVEARESLRNKFHHSIPAGLRTQVHYHLICIFINKCILKIHIFKIHMYFPKIHLGTHTSLSRPSGGLKASRPLGRPKAA